MLTWNSSEGQKEVGIPQKTQKDVFIFPLSLTCKWNPSEGVWYPSEGGTLYLCVFVNDIPHEEFGISQKDVHFIYV